MGVYKRSFSFNKTPSIYSVSGIVSIFNISSITASSCSDIGSVLKGPSATAAVTTSSYSDIVPAFKV